MDRLNARTLAFMPVSGRKPRGDVRIGDAGRFKLVEPLERANELFVKVARVQRLPRPFFVERSRARDLATQPREEIPIPLTGDRMQCQKIVVLLNLSAGH